jgi:hypothetical protein
MDWVPGFGSSAMAMALNERTTPSFLILEVVWLLSALLLVILHALTTARDVWLARVRLPLLLRNESTLIKLG